MSFWQALWHQFWDRCKQALSLNPPPAFTGTRLRVALVIGHNEREPGAYALSPLATNEWPFNRQVAQALLAQSGADPRIEIAVFYRCPTPGVSTAQEIDKVYAEVDQWGADVSLELHFNAEGSGGASYPLVLSSGTPGSRKLAAAFAAHFTDSLGGECQIWDQRRWERGGRSLWAGRAPALLLEPFFGTHGPSVTQAAKRGAAGFAKLYLNALTTYQKDLTND